MSDMPFREKLLEILLGLFPLIGIAVPSILSFKRKLEDSRYQSGGVGMMDLFVAGMVAFVWGAVAYLFVVLVVKLLEIKGIPATDYIRRFWE